VQTSTPSTSSDVAADEPGAEHANIAEMPDTGIDAETEADDDNRE
jgi:hypothetical protein